MKFLTGKHVSRRHILRGVGRRACAAAARCDVARRARHRAGSRCAQAFRRRVRSARRAARASGTRRRSARASSPPSSSQPLGAVSRRADGRVAARESRSRGTASRVASWLSGTVPKRTVAEDVRAGKTIDQVIADKIGSDTVFKSLEVATEDFTGYIGGCDPAYACAYFNTLAWHSETEPLPMEINPRNLFERMFGRPGTAAQRLERMHTGRSILDSVQEDLARLAARRRCRRIARGSATTSITCAKPRSASSARSARPSGDTHDSRCAGRHSRLVRRARRAAVRAASRSPMRPTSRACSRS